MAERREKKVPTHKGAMQSQEGLRASFKER